MRDPGVGVPVGGAGQAQVLAQRAARVEGAEPAAVLEQRDRSVDEPFQVAAWLGGREMESVHGAAAVPGGEQAREVDGAAAVVRSAGAAGGTGRALQPGSAGRSPSPRSIVSAASTRRLSGRRPWAAGACAEPLTDRRRLLGAGGPDEDDVRVARGGLLAVLAEIRDSRQGASSTGQLHMSTRGGTFSVRGPAIVPSPAVHPVTVVDAATEHSEETAARHADVVLIRTTRPEEAAAVRERLRARAAAHGRRPDSLRVLAALTIDLGDGERPAEPGWRARPYHRRRRRTVLPRRPRRLAGLLAAWHRGGAVDGFHLAPAEPRRDLERLVNGTVALLQHRSRFAPSTRRHAARAPGLTRPANRYAHAGGPS